MAQSVGQQAPQLPQRPPPPQAQPPQAQTTPPVAPTAATPENLNFAQRAVDDLAAWVGSMDPISSGKAKAELDALTGSRAQTDALIGGDPEARLSALAAVAAQRDADGQGGMIGGILAAVQSEAAQMGEGVLKAIARPQATLEAFEAFDQKFTASAKAYTDSRIADPSLLIGDAKTAATWVEEQGTAIHEGFQTADAEGRGGAYAGAGLFIAGSNFLPNSKIKYVGRVGAVADNSAASAADKLRKAPDHDLANALRGFTADQHRIGNSTFDLRRGDDSAGLEHILGRHHPEFRADTGKATQTDFHKSVTVNDVRKIVADVLQQNRDALSDVGPGNKEVVGWADGQAYSVAVRNGEVKSMFPLTEQGLADKIAAGVTVAPKP